MGQIVNGPDGCGRNWSKPTVYPGIRQLQPPTEIKGNVWIVHLDPNNRGEMSKHIPTHKMEPYGSHLTWLVFKTCYSDCMEKVTNAVLYNIFPH